MTVQFTKLRCYPTAGMRHNRTAADSGMSQTVFGGRMLVRQDYNADKNLNFEKQIKLNA
jgi:hypothetical protein